MAMVDVDGSSLQADSQPESSDVSKMSVFALLRYDAYQSLRMRYKLRFCTSALRRIYSL